MEQFSIPGAGGIIVQDIDGQRNILMQTRVKPLAPQENGLLEIPAGKIRAFESIFDTLKREVKEVNDAAPVPTIYEYIVAKAW